MKQDRSHDVLRAFYDGHYYADAVLKHKVSRHLRHLARQMITRPQMWVLDVACGTGEWLSAVKEQGAIVTGIDIASTAVAIAAKRIPQGRFCEGVAESLPFSGRTFDLVTCLGALEHFPDKEAALNEMRRVLNEGGRVIVLVPNAGFLTRRLGLYSGTEQARVREDVLSLGAWQALFEANGFRVDRRWRDLHVLSAGWLLQLGWLRLVPRLIQALALVVWPLNWQYQVYHLLTPVDVGE